MNGNEPGHDPKKVKPRQARLTEDVIPFILICIILGILIRLAWPLIEQLLPNAGGG